MGDDAPKVIKLKEQEKNISYHLLAPIMSRYEQANIDASYLTNVYLFRDIDDFNKYITLGITDGIYVTMTFKDDVYSYYVTDSELLNDIKLILESKYSLLSKVFKDKVLSYIRDNNLTITDRGMVNPVICILEPDNYRYFVAEYLDVDIGLLKEVGELGNHIYLTKEIMDKESKQSMSLTAEFTVITKKTLESEKTKLKISIDNCVVDATFISKESVNLSYDVYRVHIRKNSPIVFPEGSNEGYEAISNFVAEGGYLLISTTNVVEVL